MVGERLKKVAGNEPVLRRVGDRIDKRASNIRNRQSRRVRMLTPSMDRRNLGDGMAVGAAGSAVASAIEAYLPIGSDTEIVGVSESGKGVVYTVNIDAPFENLARAEASLESGTGFTSFITDKIEVKSASVLRSRPLRDTYQVEVYIED